MKVGFNKLNITPKESVNIAGYNRSQKSIGVLDPIEINSIVFSIHGKMVILSVLDSIIIENSVIIPTKNEISQKYNIPLENIIIGCIHTHSAPAYFKPYFEDVAVEQELQKQLIKQFEESIDNAIQSLQNMEYKISYTTIEGLYGNRNKMNGYSDKNIYIFDFYSKENSETNFSLISMACHPTILNGSNYKLSADLFGALRKKFKEQFHRECMIINGCCGDVSTRFYRELSGEAELERVSDGIVKQLEDLQTLVCQISNIQTSQIVNEYTFDARYQEFTQNEINHLTQKINESTNQNEKLIAESLLRNLKIKEERSPMTLTLTSHIIVMGELIFISLPGDITSPLGKMIRDAFPNHLVIIVGYCENYSNYFVCEEDYGKYFESYISRLEKGNADLFIQNVINETNRLLK